MFALFKLIIYFYYNYFFVSNISLSSFPETVDLHHSLNGKFNIFVPTKYKTIIYLVNSSFFNYYSICLFSIVQYIFSDIASECSKIFSKEYDIIFVRD